LKGKRLKTTTICLIRHGETPWNTERRIQGHTDIGLNEAGLDQAHAAAAWLQNKHPKISQMYSSDLSRAWLTACTIANGLRLSPIPDSQLRERRYGNFEGLTYQQAEEQFPTDYQAFEGRIPEFAIPGDGESLIQLYSRITQSLQKIAEAHLGETVAIVCHGGVLDIVNRFVRQKPLHEKRDFDVPNAGLNWIRFQPHTSPTWTILEWGSTAHLNGNSMDELP
jgi:2,3-bisphosphoglycerate-dependent phosphoglycerate mutase